MGKAQNYVPWEIFTKQKAPSPLEAYNLVEMINQISLNKQLTQE